MPIQSDSKTGESRTENHLWSLSRYMERFHHLDMDEKRFRVLAFFSYAFCIPHLIIFAIYHMTSGDFLTAWINLFIAGIFIFFSFTVKHLSSGRIVFRVSNLLLTIAFLYYIAFGVGEGAAILWMFTLPVVIFFFLGTKQGVLWVGTAFILTVSILAFPGMFNTYSYPIGFKVRFCLILFILSALCYGLEAMRCQVEEQRIRERKKLQKALDEIKILRGFIPICSKCKKIRDDQGIWEQIEHYLEQHSEARFSHGLCPACMDDMYGDQTWYQEYKNKKIRKAETDPEKG